MQRILKTDALTAAEFGLCLLASAFVPCAVEIEKAWLHMSGESPAEARAVLS